MPTSSSVNPELGVVTAANLLRAHAAVPSRDTDAAAFVSSLRTQGEVEALCDKYGVPKEFTARPAGDLRANSTPPPGAICVYARSLEAGMRLPLQGFFSDVLAHFGIAPAQLTPNGWRAMAGFLALCDYAGVPPSLAVFRRFFVMCSLSQEHEKGWYLFRPRRDSSGLRFRGLLKPDSNPIMRWKHEFFFLSSPEPWPCAVEWRVRSNRSSNYPVLTVEESQSMLKLLSAHGGAAVDLRNLLPATCSRPRSSRLCNSNLAAASPLPPPPPSSIRMDLSVHDMMKTVMAEKAAAQASASPKKRTWEEANSGQEVQPEHFASRYDRDTTKAARELLELASAANEPSNEAATRQAANYALELEQKLVAREDEAAALREQLEEAKNELAAAKRTAEAEREMAKSEVAAARTELETTKAELAAAKRTAKAQVAKTKAELAVAKQAAEAAVAKTKAELAAAKQATEATEAEAVKTKAELAAALAEAVKTKAELAAAKRATETEVAQANAEHAEANRTVEEELVKAKAKLAAAEAELVSAKSAAAVHELLASEENVRRRAELALEGYERWRGSHAPAGRAA
ncbi:uncharacterized protein LOC123411379 [Hordeum vulgare subsp. vulgare]|uniref:Transposase (putative) gypsy type domain-containing protein n=1 Tax=Hordeum vulgare subsp. vulgare TaxID=112509 RepID=A0A8I6YJL0_HORVV|nr:uncharacterized protein LOC123411379 [Hordeum vulgare subsp. vulgare]